MSKKQFYVLLTVVFIQLVTVALFSMPKNAAQIIFDSNPLSVEKTDRGIELIYLDPTILGDTGSYCSRGFFVSGTVTLHLKFDKKPIDRQATA